MQTQSTMRLLLFLYFSFVSLCLIAQTSLSGSVVDTSGQALPAANVVLLKQSDSTLVAFGNSNGKGNFLLKNVGAGDYLLRCSFLGHRRPEQPISIAATDQMLDLGSLVMYPEEFLLDGIEVNGYRIPIRMRGDTVVFDADAFAAGPNAVVEDLLRRLPGMTIAPSGAIQFNGKAVKEVMVNGKPFFKGNSQIVTKNLDASAVENVEVFDQQSDQEIVSGVDDQQENITLNLAIKESAKHQVFGQLYAGIGHQERYQAGGKVFKIGDRSQFGSIGLFNNINETGFDPSTAMGWSTPGAFHLGSSSEGQLPISWRGQISGDNRTSTGGINYGSSIGKRSNLALAYVLLDKKQRLNINETDEYTGSLLGRQSNILRESQRHTYSHRFTIDLDTKADTSSGFDLQLTAFSTGDKGKVIDNGTLIENGDSITFSSNNNSKNGQVAMVLDANYNKRLGKRGRTIGLHQQLLYGANSQLFFGEQSGFAQAQIPGLAALNAVDRDGQSPRFSSNSRLAFTTPLGKQLRWESKLAYEQKRNTLKLEYLNAENDQELYQLNNKQQLVSIGNGLELDWKAHKIKLSMRFSTLDWQLSNAINKRERLNYWLPQFSYRTRMKRASYHLSLQSDVIVPENESLQELAQVQSGLNLHLGNASLRPARQFNLMNFYYFADNFSGFNSGIHWLSSYQDQAIGYDLSLIGQQQRHQLINVSHRWLHTLNLNAEQRVDFLAASISANGQLRLTSSPASINGVISNSKHTAYQARLKLSKSINDKSFLSLSYEKGWKINNFNNDAQLIRNNFSNLSGMMQLEFAPSWRIETELGYTKYNSEFESSQDLLVWNASLEIRPFKKLAHYFMITANDLLNSNTTINQEVMPFLTRTRRANALGRYVMLSLHWKL